ncbi:Gfo/Idh/MocA family protein [Microbacterium karelineae]|uniref:Gfo/Idh/MocA family protein n=1 Tax=Microbacterium karelineae TaxID=2654283 RepID=UPI0012E9BDA1|nr:Gfo/Idh/MocA family oxidoreductase [Microbacterium karelineae]
MTAPRETHPARDDQETPAMTAPRLGLIGTGGHGRTHLARALRLHEAGRVRLAAVADPHPPEVDALPAGTTRFADGAEMLAAGGTDIVVICTPIHTHFILASAAIAGGNDVLLEKPTTATLDEFERLTALADRAGARVQIGFQSLGSGAIGLVRSRVAAGEIGDVVRYAATGAWVRDDVYWTRSPWAGRRTLDDRVVADGVLTNPLAHATATALAIAGATEAGDVASLELDLWRANDIEADDTSVAIFGLPGGVRLTTAVTLAAAAHAEPYVEVVGTRGSLRFWYKSDRVDLRGADGAVRETIATTTVDLLENLLAARERGDALLAPIAATGAFMRLVDGVVAAPAPTPIPAAFVSERDDDRGRHLVVAGIEDELERALAAEATFTAIGSPFTAVRS